MRTKAQVLERPGRRLSIAARGSSRGADEPGAPRPHAPAAGRQQGRRGPARGRRESLWDQLSTALFGDDQDPGGGAPSKTPFQASFVGKEFEIDDADAQVRNDDGTARTWAAGDTIPAGKKAGDPVVIPKGTKVKVSGTKGEGDANRLVNVDGLGLDQGHEPRGRLPRRDASRSDAKFLSTGPHPQDRRQSRRPPSAPRAPAIRRRSRRQSSRRGRSSRVTGDRDRRPPSCASRRWTAPTSAGPRRRTSPPRADGMFTGRTPPRRPGGSRPSATAATRATIPIGTLVIVEEVSSDSDPKGAYVRVAKTKQDGGKRVKGDELGWTAPPTSSTGGPRTSTARPRPGREAPSPGRSTWSTSSTRAGTPSGPPRRAVTVPTPAAGGGRRRTRPADRERLPHVRGAAGAPRQVPGRHRQQGRRGRTEQPPERHRARPQHQGLRHRPLRVDDRSTPRRYGYIRTVDKEHWHWEYHPTEAAEMAKTGKFKRAGVSP